MWAWATCTCYIPWASSYGKVHRKWKWLQVTERAFSEFACCFMFHFRILWSSRLASHLAIKDAGSWVGWVERVFSVQSGQVVKEPMHHYYEIGSQTNYNGLHGLDWTVLLKYFQLVGYLSAPFMVFTFSSQGTCGSYNIHIIYLYTFSPGAK